MSQATYLARLRSKCRPPVSDYVKNKVNKIMTENTKEDEGQKCTQCGETWHKSEFQSRSRKCRTCLNANGRKRRPRTVKIKRETEQEMSEMNKLTRMKW